MFTEMNQTAKEKAEQIGQTDYVETISKKYYPRMKNLADALELAEDVASYPRFAGNVSLVDGRVVAVDPTINPPWVFGSWQQWEKTKAELEEIYGKPKGALW